MLSVRLRGRRGSGEPCQIGSNLHAATSGDVRTVHRNASHRKMGCCGGHSRSTGSFVDSPLALDHEKVPPKKSDLERAESDRIARFAR